MLLIRYLIRDMKTRVPAYRKELVKVAGTQQRTNVMVINCEEYIDLTTSELKPIGECSFVWMGRCSPGPDFERHFSTPTNITPLTNFMDQAQEVLGDVFGVAILAWSALYSLNIYRWTVEHLRHFNLPVLYGEPMVGKTLIASCGAWLNGCPKTAITSRNTMSFLTKMTTSSTFPFIWDDPTTAEEVSQLAIDLGNGAVRGKGTDDPRVPATGCLITANFTMAETLKYFSRVLLLKIERNTPNKGVGDARDLELSAEAASCSYPLVMGKLHHLRVDDVHQETEILKTELNADIRIVEGISLQIHIAKKLLNLCQRDHYMAEVDQYVAETLLPYYRHALLQRPTVEPALEPTDDIIDIQDVTLDNSVLIKGGTVLAVGNGAVMTSTSVVRALGGRPNKPTKFNGRVKKMVHLPKGLFTPDKWEIIYRRMTEDEAVDPAMDIMNQDPDPAVPDPVVLNPVVPDPFVLDPAVPDPVVLDTAVPDPVVLDPAVPDPVVLNPVVPDPVVLGPAVPDPVVLDPAVPDPVVLDPVVPDPVVLDPAVPDPVVINPAVPDPVVLDPVVPDPVVFDPAVPDPVVLDPAVSDTIVLDPAVPDPVVLDPAVPDPVVLNPVVPDPVVLDPAVPDPVVLDPAVHDPVALDPAVQEPRRSARDLRATRKESAIKGTRNPIWKV